ncbi:P-type conjugative transfer protein VirB9 [Bartonella henselae]|nr:P-type conjugative transfer protein VirB9 [Bartonella henselae]ATP12996.1 P-type conjugative transfer protein VirB9 [Bartonella henselae]ETS04178.1 P-type conjugative transfer protein VirB9 [Bartonella henselae JK 50]ETS05006.1 P-type conjugative transfer protein VirB9 [Bartonella henselae JK 51]MDM9990269.1 P-type conjugative transfer protein VirB9 [Bartonella henselae]OLL42491.1 TrwF protein [Bartonella henselae]
MKKLAFMAFLSSFSFFYTVPVQALKTPSSSEYDHRIRYVTYNVADVVQIETVIGVATHIILEEGERYITHAFGDSEAYAFAHKGRHIFIKPKAELANTNLIVVTDKRSYKFRLQFRNDRAGATYELAFHYPDTNTQNLEENKQRLAIERGFHQSVNGYNLSYTMSGNQDIAPINAWDNGRITYFKFPANMDMPSIYLVDAEGNESLISRTVVGNSNDIIAVHKVNPKWLIRLGKRALAVFNEAYDSNGIPNTTGTISSVVHRINKGGK